MVFYISSSPDYWGCESKPQAELCAKAVAWDCIKRFHPIEIKVINGDEDNVTGDIRQDEKHQEIQQWINDNWIDITYPIFEEKE